MPRTNVRKHTRKVNGKRTTVKRHSRKLNLSDVPKYSKRDYSPGSISDKHIGKWHAKRLKPRDFQVWDYGDSLYHLHIADITQVPGRPRNIIEMATDKPYVVWVAVFSGDPNFVRGFNTIDSAERWAYEYMKNNQERPFSYMDETKVIFESKRKEKFYLVSFAMESSHGSIVRANSEKEALSKIKDSPFSGRDVVWTEPNSYEGEPYDLSIEKEYSKEEFEAMKRKMRR